MVGPGQFPRVPGDVDDTDVGRRQDLHKKAVVPEGGNNVRYALVQVVEGVAHDDARDLVKRVLARVGRDRADASVAQLYNVVETLDPVLFFLLLHSIQLLQINLGWHQRCYKTQGS